MVSTETVRAKNGTAVISAEEIHELRGAWTATELKGLFRTMDGLKEASK